MFVGYPHDIFDDSFSPVEPAERIFNDLKKWETTVRYNNFPFWFNQESPRERKTFF